MMFVGEEVRMVDEHARAVVDLLRGKGLTIMKAGMVLDHAKTLLMKEPLREKEVAAQVECAATENWD